MEKLRFLKEEERKCPKTVMNAVMETIKLYDGATLDCGHIIDGKNKVVVLAQQEDGQFLALCEKCGSE